MTHQATVEAMLTAGGVSRVYDVGGVPERPAAPYVVLSVLPADALTYTNDAGHSVRDQRATLQVFGRTSSSVLATVGAVDVALLDQWVTPDGPARLELPPASMDRDSDAGGLVGVTLTYTFATTNQETP